MQTEDYVLACYRNIELNPVRAGMVMRPQDYRWSSYHTNALGKANRFIVPHEQYPSPFIHSGKSLIISALRSQVEPGNSMLPPVDHVS